MINLKDSAERLPPVQMGEVIEGIKIVSEGRNNSTDGVARVSGYIIFVPGTKRGDIVNIKITTVRDNFARGELV